MNAESASAAPAPAPDASAVPKFRAIIVGGGPAGLGLANALSKANIDYVLLERGNTVVVESGASIALWPQNVRVMDQFGLLDQANKKYIPMGKKYNMRLDGTEITNNMLYQDIETSHGHPWMLFARPDLLDMLYRNLPNKETTILTNKKVNLIETLPTGVKVHCEDSTTYSGSIVIGCDGVHSTARNLMASLAATAKVNLGNSPHPMKTTYQALIVHVDLVPGLQPGELWETRGRGTGVQLLVGPTSAYIFVYKKLATPTSEDVRYTAADAEQFADGIMDRAVAKDIKFRDLWKGLKWTRIVHCEEGVLKRWHYDRVVLVGDSVHKMTPNAGFSLNTGWQGVVELTNRLHSLLATTPDPSTKALDDVFRRYQQGREKLARNTAMFSAVYIRTTTWTNLLFRFMDWLTPYVGGDTLLLKILASPIVKKGITLDFVEETALKEGTVPWVNKRGAPESTAGA